MIKFIANFLFILILFVMATALPLSMDIFSINLSPTIVDTKDESSVPSAIRPNYTVIENELPLFADDFNFTIKSSTGQFESNYLESFNILIKGNKGAEKNYPLKDLTPALTQGDERLFTLSTQELLKNLPPDYYTIQLEGTSIATVVNNDQREFSYSTHKPNVSRDQILQTLYFPLADFSEIVPINRSINTQNNRIRSAYNALVAGPPIGYGLYDQSPSIPQSPNLRLSNGIVSVYWYASQLNDFDLDLNTVKLAVANTLLTHPSVEGVTFYYNDSQGTEYQGLDWTKIYRQSDDPHVFMSLATESNHLFLSPIPLSDLGNTPIENQVKIIWQALNFTVPLNPINLNWVQIVPPSLTLNDFQLENDLLTLDFNKVFEDFYKNSPDLNEHLIDVIVQSFTSIDGVNNIQIKIEGQISELESLQSPLIASPFINVLP